MPHWIDTHCHLDAPEFAADADGVRAQARAAGVQHIVIPAVQVAHADAVRSLAHRHGDSYALGIHPLYTPQAADDDLECLADLLAQYRCDPHLVAVGEIGLDFFVPGLDAERQTRFYRQQLQLARRFDLPVILHVRRSADALLKQLRARPVRGGIAHAFNGSRQQAEEFIKLGFALGFGGAMTYAGSTRIRELARHLPLEAIVLETDAPDIPPAWLNGGRNTPAELPRIAAVLAELRELPVAELVQRTAANARAVLPGI